MTKASAEDIIQDFITTRGGSCPNRHLVSRELDVFVQDALTLYGIEDQAPLMHLSEYTQDNAKKPSAHEMLISGEVVKILEGHEFQRSSTQRYGSMTLRILTLEKEKGFEETSRAIGTKNRLVIATEKVDSSVAENPLRIYGETSEAALFLGGVKAVAIATQATVQQVGELEEKLNDAADTDEDEPLDVYGSVNYIADTIPAIDFLTGAAKKRGQELTPSTPTLIIELSKAITEKMKTVSAPLIEKIAQVKGIELEAARLELENSERVKELLISALKSIHLNIIYDRFGKKVIENAFLVPKSLIDATFDTFFAGQENQEHEVMFNGKDGSKVLHFKNHILFAAPSPYEDMYYVAAYA